jgi:hypothetical protein
MKLHRAILVVALLLATATGKAQSFDPKTNALYDLALIPNVGAEVTLGKQ